MRRTIHRSAWAITAVLLLLGTGCDLVEARLSAPEFSDLGAESRAAYDLLRETTLYSPYDPGIVVTPSQESRAFGILYEAPPVLRAEAYERLLREGTLAGQLYALTGLYLTDRARYDAVAGPYRRNDRLVQTVGGCVLYEGKVSDLVAEIDAGVMPQAMLEAADQKPSNQHPEGRHE